MCFKYGNGPYLVPFPLQIQLSQQPESSQDSVQSERWEDHLSKALGTREKTGRVRGIGSGAIWDEVFPQDRAAARQRRRGRQTSLMEEMIRAAQEAGKLAAQQFLESRGYDGRDATRPPLHPHGHQSSYPSGWSSCASASDVAPESPNPLDNITVSFVTTMINC